MAGRYSHLHTDGTRGKPPQPDWVCSHCRRGMHTACVSLRCTCTECERRRLEEELDG